MIAFNERWIVLTIMRRLDGGALKDNVQKRGLRLIRNVHFTGSRRGDFKAGQLA